MAQAHRKFTGFIIIFLTIAADQLRIPMVNCQEEVDTTQCLPRKTFLAFLRLPEVSSNLAAYSRTARIIQAARNDFLNLKILGTNQDDQADDAKICLPSSIYYEIFSDPTIRAHFGAIERAQKMLEYPEDGFIDSEKRSIATLAKNGDLPITTAAQERDQKSQDDEEKRNLAGMTPEELVKIYNGDGQEDKTSADVIDHYTLPNGELDVEAMSRDYHNGKRNIGNLARDYALPERRNIAALAREYGLPSGKRNVASLARDRMIPSSGKRTVPLTYGRYMWLKGKRNVGSLARDFGLPSGKRNISYLAKNGWLNLGYTKRNVGTLARDRILPETRTGRSTGTINDNNEDNISLQNIAELSDIINQSRVTRQIDYSDEYPLPVLQNANLFDYDDIVEAFAATGRYPLAQKRFMGTGTLVEDSGKDDEELLRYPPNKRHIGSLARLGWLPTFRAARFSRSPRYLLARKDPTDGSATNAITPDSSSRLNIDQSGSRTRYVQLPFKGSCRHGFKQYLLIPTIDNNYLHGNNIHFPPINYY